MEFCLSDGMGISSIFTEQCAEIRHPEFPDLIQQFIYNQQHSEDISNTSISDLPMFYGKITIYSLAVTTFHAPSDISALVVCATNRSVP